MVKSKTLTEKKFDFVNLFKYAMYISFFVMIIFSVASIILLLFNGGYYNLSNKLDDMLIGTLIFSGLYLFTKLIRRIR